MEEINNELTAEEAVKAYAEMCHTMQCEYCKLNRHNNGFGKNCRTFCIENTDEAIKIIAEWKSDHENKEPEIEWVYRVYNGESEEFVDSEEKAISECEFLVKDNQNKYAFYQKVCRVKAVE